MSAAAGTLYRRSLRRVERRVTTLVQREREMFRSGALRDVDAAMNALRLQREAVRTTNRLAYAAGIAGPLAPRTT